MNKPVTTINPAIIHNQTNFINYLIQQSLYNLNTLFPAKVTKVDGLRLNVETIINQMALNQASPPPIVIEDIPVAQLCGGVAGIIIEYKVGDVVMCGCVQRDISSIKNKWTRSNPASSRVFNYADAIVLFKLSNELPSIYIKITNNGIDIEGDSKPINVTTTGDATIKANNTTVEATGDATIKGTSVNVEATGTATIQASNAIIDASTVSLGANATAGVLLGNQPLIATIAGVQPGTGVTGVAVTLTGGSTTVKASI